MLDSACNDPAFFAAIHEAMESSDRRRGERRDYECVQLLAAFDGQELPGQQDFQHERCCDLSPQGMSFLTRRPPNQPFLVVALGEVPFTFVVAKIIRVTPLEQPGLVKIGCEFQRKI